MLRSGWVSPPPADCLSKWRIADICFYNMLYREFHSSFILCVLLFVLSLLVPAQLESGTKRPFQENEEGE